MHGVDIQSPAEIIFHPTPAPQQVQPAPTPQMQIPTTRTVNPPHAGL